MPRHRRRARKVVLRPQKGQAGTLKGPPTYVPSQFTAEMGSTSREEPKNDTVLDDEHGEGETQAAPPITAVPKRVVVKNPAKFAPRNPTAGKAKASTRRFATLLPKLAKWLGYLACVPLVLTLIYAVVPPPFSNVMVLRAIAGYGMQKDWVSLDQISPNLARAVITSEDQRFCAHWGVDWTEMGGVIEDVFDDDEGPVRGASTISMQTAKNLFLWDGRSFLRKGLEMPLALWMDLVWSKRRMIEIYLNIVEWAPGVYGAEAASQFHFRKSAKNLTKREAALLAAVLPNPLKRRAGKPSRRVNAAANRIQGRVSNTAPYLTCVP